MKTDEEEDDGGLAELKAELEALKAKIAVGFIREEERKTPSHSPTLGGDDD